LVDACRNNPLVKYFQNGRHNGSIAKKGLGQVTPTVGQVVIGFATSAGDTADDGTGKMSPFAKALSVRLKEPNKDITKVLGLVALDVSAKYEQNPIYRANLAYDVILNKKEQLTVDSTTESNHLQIVSLTSEQKIIKKKFDNLVNVYQENIVKLDKYYLWLYKDNSLCKNNSHFQQVGKGITIFTSYYYLFRADILFNSYNKFQYPTNEKHRNKRLTFKKILSNMTSFFIPATTPFLYEPVFPVLQVF
jgi:hypothetical protein